MMPAAAVTQETLYRTVHFRVYIKTAFNVKGFAIGHRRIVHGFIPVPVKRSQAHGLTGISACFRPPVTPAIIFS